MKGTAVQYVEAKQVVNRVLEILMPVSGVQMVVTRVISALNSR